MSVLLERTTMPQDTHTTVKFPKVVPVTTPLPVPVDGRAARAASPSQPADEPEWYNDPPTIRAMHVAIAVQVASTPDRALLTVLAGLNAGQVFAVERDETSIGRAHDADVRVDDAGISRKHARLLRTFDRHILEDLGSTNGVYVNGRRVERIDLADGDRIQVGPSLVLRFGLIAADEAALARQLYEGSTRDALTQLYNRKYAGERLAAEVAYSHRHGTRLSLIIFDIDHFKRVNDTFGHLAGDVVLRVVAAQAQKTVRAEDVVARYGGEEFVVIVRGIEHANVCVLADRIRKAVERLTIPWESRTIKTTISLGVASLDEGDLAATVEALVALADERLYRAKAGGRNRLC